MSKSKILGKLVNLVLTDGDETQQLPATGTVPLSTGTMPSSVTAEKVIPASVYSQQGDNMVIPPSTSGKVNEQVLEQLCVLMDSLDTGRANYLKYKKSVDALKEYQPDESARFLTAFISLRPNNPDLTKDGLMASVDRYISLVTNEGKMGLDDLNELRKNEIGAIEKSLEARATELAGLEQKVENLRRSIADDSANVLAKRSDYQNKEDDFNATIAVVLNQLQEDKVKINQILK